MAAGNSSIDFTMNVSSINTVVVPYPVFHPENPFSEHGSLVSLERLPAEGNVAYRRRILDVYSNVANSTYTGMINGVTRELGLSLFEGIEINPRVDANGIFLCPDPYIVFDGSWLLLYSDYANGNLDWAIDRLKKGGNYEHLGRLVDFVNTTAFFEAKMRPNVDTFVKSATILNQSSRFSVDFEYVKASTKFRLKKWPLVNGSVYFSSPTTFKTEKTSTASVLAVGDYHIDYNTGVVTVFTTPNRRDHVRYQYTKYPFYATASPVIIHDINRETFKVQMFNQIFSLDENDFVNGLPTELGVDIINELLSIAPMYWGE